jgi:hypothetical protein
MSRVLQSSGRLYVPGLTPVESIFIRGSSYRRQHLKSLQYAVLGGSTHS